MPRNLSGWKISVVLILLRLILPGSADVFALENQPDYGADYAFLTLMTLSPDFSASNYTIENKDGTKVHIKIGRFPHRITLAQGADSASQLEVTAAYQKTAEKASTFPLPEEFIDARWTTLGIGLGLIYEKKLNKRLSLIPSLRAGLSRIENRTNYNGDLTRELRTQLDEVLFNWRTDTALLNVGLGFRYNWKIFDRSSTLDTNIHRLAVESINEDNDNLKFSEQTNMAKFKADIVIPTNFEIENRRLDAILLLGTNYFFGKNRNTLGYNISHQVGTGCELPLKWHQKAYGHLRLSGQFLWAKNMRGWMITMGYNPE